SLTVYHCYLNKYDEVLHDLAMVSKLKTGNPLPLSSRYPEALQDYSAIIRANSQDEDALCKRADVYVRMGRFDTALSDLDKSIELYPLSATAFLARSKVLDKLGHAERAEEDRLRAKSLTAKPAVDKI
ncbi:MAG: hypothetical protein K8F91_00720, partial [Candidatus Obscuribacterales bacterium]|nr:hypothetical protein [Candidatus Obscuribacterales bacterium]